MPLRVRSRRSSSPSPPPAKSAQPFGLPLPPPNWAQKPPGISLCMIVKNEERFLEAALRSVEGAVDEICIVDTGSTDRTVEIARAFGAIVAHREWRNDFAWARNQALELATKRWIFQLDADEELLEASREHLAALRGAAAHVTGLWVRCINEADDYAGSGAMSHLLVRVFPNHERIRYRGIIHEFAALDGAQSGLGAVAAPLAIVHHGYLKSVVAERNKGQRNLEMVRAAAEREPEDPFHWFNLGMTAYIVGQTDAAIEALEKMRELTGNSPRAFVPNGLATLADAYTERKGRPERGLEIATQALRYSPNYANAHFSLGKALVELKRFDEARHAYMLAIEDRAHNDKQFVVDDEVCVWKAHTEIGNTYVYEGDDEKALEWFEKGIANRPTVQPIRINRAKALERLGRLEEAQAAYRELYDDFTDEQTALHYVNYLLRHGQERAAADVIERACERVSPRAGATMLVAAAAIAQRNGWPDVRRYLVAAARLCPGSADALNPLEALYRESGDREALEALLASELLHPAVDPADFLRRSHRFLSEQNYTEARRWAIAGLERSPEHALLRYNAAIACANLGEKEEAVEHLGRVTREAPEAFGRARYLQAVLLRELQRPEQALRAVEEVVNGQPENVDAALLRAALLDGLGRAVEAESALAAAMPYDRQRVAVELASLYLRAGRVADAQRVAAQALA